MLNEKELRKSTFTEGNKVELADGQEWTFPRPRLRFFPHRGVDGKIGLGAQGTFDDEYRALFVEFADMDRDNVYEVWSLRIRIACHLLLANYDLTDVQLADLLPAVFEDEANMQMWEALHPVLLSQPPKLSTDGSNTP
jgi:hypothetical protein